MQGIRAFVVSIAEIVSWLKQAVGMLILMDRAKIKPAIDKVIGEY